MRKKGGCHIVKKEKKKDNLCVIAKKNKRVFFFFSREAYIRIIVIDLDNNEIIQSLSRNFSLQEKEFSM